MIKRKSKYDPYYGQIISLQSQGRGLKEIHRILYAQGVGGTYSGFYSWCRSNGIYGSKQAEYDRNQNLAQENETARRAGMTYGKLEAMRYAAEHRIMRKW